jgi:hypothetical protein
MQISIQKDHGRLDVLNEWLRQNCPKNFLKEYEGKTYKVVGGRLAVVDFSGSGRNRAPEGSPVTDNAQNNALLMRTCKAQNRKLRVRQPVTDNRVCLACLNGFCSIRKDAKFCSAKCRQKAKREQEARARRKQQERILTES